MKKIFIKGGISLLALLSLGSATIARQYINTNLGHNGQPKTTTTSSEVSENNQGGGSSDSEQLPNQSIFQSKDEVIDETKEIEQLLNRWKAKVKARKDDASYLESEEGKSRFEEWKELIKNDSLEEYKDVWEFYRVYKFAKNVYQERDDDGENGTFEAKIKKLKGMKEKEQVKEIFNILHSDEDNIKEKIAALYLDDVKQTKKAITTQLRTLYEKEYKDITITDEELFKIWNENNVDGSLLLQIWASQSQGGNKWLDSQEYKNLHKALIDPANEEIDHDKLKLKWLSVFRSKAQNRDFLFKVFKQKSFSGFTVSSFLKTLTTGSWFNKYKFDHWYKLDSFKYTKAKAHYEILLLDKIVKSKAHIYNLFDKNSGKEDYNLWLTTDEGGDYIKDSFATTDLATKVYTKAKWADPKLTKAKWQEILTSFSFKTGFPQAKAKEFHETKRLLSFALKKYQKDGKSDKNLAGMKLYSLFVWKQMIQKMADNLTQLDGMLKIDSWAGFDQDLKVQKKGGYDLLKNYKKEVSEMSGISPTSFQQDDLALYCSLFWHSDVKRFTKEVFNHPDTSEAVKEKNKKDFFNATNIWYEKLFDSLPPFIYGNSKFYDKQDMSEFEKKIDTKNIPKISLKVKDIDEALNFKVDEEMYQMIDGKATLTLLGEEVWNWVKRNFDLVYKDLGYKQGYWVTLSDDKKEPPHIVGWGRDESAYEGLGFSLEKYLFQEYYKQFTKKAGYDKEKLFLVRKIFFAMWLFNNLDQVTKYVFSSKKAHFAGRKEKIKNWKKTQYYKDFEKDYSIRKYLASAKNKKDEYILESYTMDRLESYVEGVIPWDEKVTYSQDDYDKWVDKIDQDNSKLLKEIFKNSAFFSEDLAIEESDKVRKEFSTKLINKDESSKIVNLVKKWFIREYVPSIKDKVEFTPFEDTKSPEEFISIFKNNPRFRKIFLEELGTFTKSYDNQMWLATHRPAHYRTSKYKGWLDTQDFRDRMRAIMRMTSTFKDAQDGLHHYMPFNNAVVSMQYRPGQQIFRDNIAYHLLQDKTLKMIFNEQKSPIGEWKKLINAAIDRGAVFKEDHQRSDWNEGVFPAKWTHYYTYVFNDSDKLYQSIWEFWKKAFSMQFGDTTKGYFRSFWSEDWIDYLLANKFQRGEIKSVKLKFIDNRYDFDRPSAHSRWIIPKQGNLEAKNWQIEWEDEKTSTNQFIKQLVGRLKEDDLLDELNALMLLHKKDKTSFLEFNEEFAQKYFEQWIDEEFKGYMINKSGEETLKWYEVEGKYEEVLKNKEEWRAFIDAISESDLKKNEYFKQWVKNKVDTSSNYYRWYKIYNQIKDGGGIFDKLKTLISKAQDKTLDINNNPEAEKLITQIFKGIFKGDLTSEEKQKVRDKIWQQYNPSPLKDTTLAEDWARLKKQYPIEVDKFVKHDNLLRKNYLDKKDTNDQYYDWIWKNYHQQISDTLISNLINDKKWSSIKGFKDFKYDIYTHNVKPDVYSILKGNKISQSIFELYAHHFDISHLYRSGAKEKAEMKRIYNNFRSAVHKFNGPLSKAELKKLRDDEKDFQERWGILNKKKVWWYPYMGKWEEILDQPRTKLHQDFNRIIVKLYLHLEDKKLHPQIENKFYDYVTGNNQFGRFLKWYQSDNSYQKAFDSIINYLQTFDIWFKDESYDPELVELFNHGFKSAASNYDFGEKWSNSEEYKSLNTASFGKLSYEQIQLQHFRKWKAKNSKLFYKAFIDDSLVSKMDAFSTSTANKDYGKITTDVFDRVKLDKFLATNFGKQVWIKELGLSIIPKLQSQLTTYNQYQEITTTPSLTLDEDKAEQWFKKWENQKKAFVLFTKSPYSDVALREINKTEKYKVSANDWSKQLDHYLKEHLGKDTGASYKGKKIKIIEKYWTLFKNTKVEYGKYYWNQIFQALIVQGKKVEGKVSQLVATVDKKKEQNPLLKTEFLRQEIVKVFAPSLADDKIVTDYDYEAGVINHRYLSQKEAMEKKTLFGVDEKFASLEKLYQKVVQKVGTKHKLVQISDDDLQPYFWNWYQKNFVKIQKLIETKNKVINGKNVNKLWLNSSQYKSYELMSYKTWWGSWGKPVSKPKAYLPYYKSQLFDAFAHGVEGKKILWSIFKTKGVLGTKGQSPYEKALKMGGYLKLINPEQEVWRDFLDEYKLTVLTARLKRLFPLIDFEINEKQFQGWKTDKKIEVLKAAFKKSYESEEWRLYYNEWAGFDWVIYNLKNYPHLVEIPHFKKALEKWIVNSTKIDGKIKPNSPLLDQAASSKDVVSKIDAYYDYIKDGKLSEFKDISDDFAKNVVQWNWFNPWLDWMIKSKMILKDIYVTQADGSALRKWNGFGATKEYKDYLKEIKDPKYSSDEAKEARLNHVVRNYLGNAGEKTSSKFKLQKALMDVYKSSQNYLDKALKKPLPLWTDNTRLKNKMGTFAQYDVDFMKSLAADYTNGDKEVVSLLADLYYLKRFLISQEALKGQTYESLDAFWKDAFTVWAKGFEFNTIENPDAYDALKVFREYYLSKK